MSSALHFVIPVLNTIFFIGIFHESLAHMVARWNGADYTHCYIMPLVIGYLIWEKREALVKAPLVSRWWGILVLTLGIFLYWIGELSGEYFTLYIASYLTFLGLLWIQLGWRKIKVILFPLILAFSIFPLPTFLKTKLTLKLQLISSALGVRFLQLLGIPALHEGNVIDIGITKFQVVEACSGLRFIYPLIIIAVLIASFMETQLWKKVFIALSSVPLAVILNALRIGGTGLLYIHFGSRVAEGFFHDFSGWIVFMLAIGILLAESLLLARISFGGKSASSKASQKASSSPTLTQAQDSGDTRADVLLEASPKFPWLHWTVAFVMLASTAFASKFIDFRQEIPLSKPLSQFPASLGPWHGNRLSLGAEILDVLDLSDYVIISYQNDDRPPVELYVAYYASQQKGESIHSPETCLPGAGWIVKSAHPITIAAASDPPQKIKVNRTVLQKFTETMIAYFWFDLDGRIATNAYQVKWYNFLNALLRHRTNGALIRVTTSVASDETVEDADRRLREFLRAALPRLQSYLRSR